ncbi:Protein CBG14419 [Caenorhabditis briggsae]|uniref:Protein CBG14419 n=1 Tax=Caenorhabditis briggsae TaxID=6238 RepID=A8XJY1_CAEBR|nr:Protein CBG14419 [Caenorhabditis briggsae]CAP32957.1 Protein CBG14419 [Caenorhabditis briggsae]
MHPTVYDMPYLIQKSKVEKKRVADCRNVIEEMKSTLISKGYRLPKQMTSLVLIITLIRETFPKTENVKKAVEEFVPGPNCVSLDVSKLEDDHGLKAFTDYDVVKDTAQFINY